MVCFRIRILGGYYAGRRGPSLYWTANQAQAVPFPKRFAADNLVEWLWLVHEIEAEVEEYEHQPGPGPEHGA